MFDSLYTRLLGFAKQQVRENVFDQNLFEKKWDVHFISTQMDDIQFQFKHADQVNQRLMTALETGVTLEKKFVKLPVSIGGAELMRQFFIDIMDRNSLESQVFSRTSAEYFGSARVISFELKILALCFVIILNLYFCFQILVYARIKGKEWQES